MVGVREEPKAPGTTRVWRAPGFPGADDRPRVRAAGPPTVSGSGGGHLPMVLTMVVAVAIAVVVTLPAWGGRSIAGKDVMFQLVRADFGLSHLLFHGRLDGWFPRFFLGHQEFLVYGPGLTWTVGVVRVLTLGTLSTAGAMKVVSLASFAGFPLAVAFVARSYGLRRNAAGFAALLSLLVSTPYGLGLQGLFQSGLIAHQVGAIFWALALGSFLRIPREPAGALDRPGRGVVGRTRPHARHLARHARDRLRDEHRLPRARGHGSRGRACSASPVPPRSVPRSSGSGSSRSSRHRDLQGNFTTWVTPNLGTRLHDIIAGGVLFPPFVGIVVVAAWLWGWRGLRTGGPYALAVLVAPAAFLVTSHTLVALWPHNIVIAQLANRGLGFAGVLATFPLAQLLGDATARCIARVRNAELVTVVAVAGVAALVVLALSPWFGIPAADRRPQAPDPRRGACPRPRRARRRPVRVRQRPRRHQRRRPGRGSPPRCDPSRHMARPRVGPQPSRRRGHRVVGRETRHQGPRRGRCHVARALRGRARRARCHRLRRDARRYRSPTLGVTALPCRVARRADHDPRRDVTRPAAGARVAAVHRAAGGGAAHRRRARTPRDPLRRRRHDDCASRRRVVAEVARRGRRPRRHLAPQPEHRRPRRQRPHADAPGRRPHPAPRLPQRRVGPPRHRRQPGDPGGSLRRARCPHVEKGGLPGRRRVPAPSECDRRNGATSVPEGGAGYPGAERVRPARRSDERPGGRRRVPRRRASATSKTERTSVPEGGAGYPGAERVRPGRRGTDGQAPRPQLRDLGRRLRRRPRPEPRQTRWVSVAPACTSGCSRPAPGAR